jgi:hypothetical protein
MTPITKRFVLRSTAPTKRDAGIFPNQLAARSHNVESTSNMQRTVGPCFNCCILWLRFLRTAVKPLEMQCAGGTRHDYFSDFIRVGGIYQNPRSILRLKDFRQAAKAIPGVIANLRFPIDNNLTLAVAILSLHAWALAFFIFGR